MYNITDLEPRRNDCGVTRTDSATAAASRALAAGDPLGALNWVALRDDAEALALRGVAMAQIGDFVRAAALLRRASKSFGPSQPVARARCTVAQAEVALVSRDLKWPAKALDSAREILEKSGDSANASYARFVAVRRLILLGRVDEAERLLEGVDPTGFPAAAEAVYALITAGIAVRRLEAVAARKALARAQAAATRAAIPALAAEVEATLATLDRPVALLTGPAGQRLMTLADVERLLAAGALAVDGCRRVLRQGNVAVSLATRPVLFELLLSLARAWPGDVPRTTLIERIFQIGVDDDLDRLHLRVEIGRLREAAKALADVVATHRGYALAPRGGRSVAVLAMPVEEEDPALLAMLSDGEAWASSALALALGASQRSVQRRLEALAAAGKVQAVGQGRSRRWTCLPGIGFTTTLILPDPLIER